MEAYKGFEKDMTCRGFQYEEGKEYEYDGEVEIDRSGFHACEYALDVFRYYAPNKSVYHKVEVDGDIRKKDGDETTKVAAKRIKIGASVDIAGIVKAAIEYTTKQIDKMKITIDNRASSATGDNGASTATGDYGASSATGYYGASSATGYCGASTATGYCGASTATGDYGASSATGDYGASTATGKCGASSATGYYGASSATGYCGASSATGYCGASTATGYCGASTATGDNGASTATGDYGASSATGYCGASTATGDYGASSATGYCGASTATGKCGASIVTGYCGASIVTCPESVAVAWGYKSRAKGVKGTYLVFADWEEEDGEDKYWSDPCSWTLKGAKMVLVDGKVIKEDTWYRIENGKIVESEE